MKNIIDEEEARELLEPYYEAIIKVYENSFSTLTTQLDNLSHNSPIYHETLSLNRTTQIWNYSVDWAKYFFSEMQGITFKEHDNNSFWFNVQELIYLRFKKLDKNRKPSNIKTNRILALENQQEIPGFPVSPTFVDAGYCLDKSGTQLSNIFIVCRNKEIERWKIDLLQETGKQLSIFNDVETAKENLANLVRIKDELKKKKTYGGSLG